LDSRLETTIDKILNQTTSELLSNLQKTFDECKESLSKSSRSLEQEYDRILDESKKESEKLEKQIIGSSELEARNKHLLLTAESVDKVFDKAIEKIQNIKKNENYPKLISTLIDESTKALGTQEIVVLTNSKDKDVVKSVLAKFPKAELSSETISCIGGVEVRSKDGTMTFNNTIDSRLERLKPLIRKDIATKFGIGE
jgi:V/A-type H+-transporting ATPase subunit E